MTAAPTLMGIINTTPDSFSDGGQYIDPVAAIAHGEKLLMEGAAILDIGGEASGPGSIPVSAETELERILPVVTSLAKRATVSVDTTKSSVARESLERGALIINDISGLRSDAAMAGTIAEYGASVVVMFSKETAEHPQVTNRPGISGDVISRLKIFFHRQIDLALAAGIAEEKIILDPGMGKYLSDDPEISWQLLRRLPELRECYPRFRILVGVSRKGFIGGERSDRDTLSQLIGVMLADAGVDIIRTHDVRLAREMFRVRGKLQRG